MTVLKALAGYAIVLLIGLSSLTLTSTERAFAQPVPVCGGSETKVRVGNEFVLVNPGSKCRYYRFRFEVARVGGVVPKICYLAKVAGSDKQYGPFCSGGANLGMPVPRPIEWISASVPVTIYVKLCNSSSECFH